MTFIDCILEIMEMIVDVLSRAKDILVSIVIGIIALFIMASLVVTVPVWIVPYLVWKRRADPE